MVYVHDAALTERKTPRRMQTTGEEFMVMKETFLPLKKKFNQLVLEMNPYHGSDEVKKAE